MKAYFALVRPQQWAKNGFIFAGYIFAGRWKEPPPVAASEAAMVLLSFLAFCLLSGFVYTVNDIKDRHADAIHPLKKNRPLASGQIPVKSAAVFAASLLLLGWLLSFCITAFNDALWFLVVAICYPMLGLLYSLLLKREVIVDVVAVAVGFVLRAVAGCVAIKVEISPWLILCTLLLSIFIALCKRRHELLLMGDNAADVRSVLPRYTAQLLDQMIAITGAATIMAYSLYTFHAPHILLGNPSTKEPQNELPLLMLTIPFVIFGLFRYLFLAHRTEVGGIPETMLKDRPFVINLLLWIVVVILLGIFSKG